MHHPTTEPRRSIYYQYKVYPAFLPTPQQTPARVPVVIVGAGPIGLSAALDLARYQVPCVLLESEQQVSEGSRAIVFTRRSLEILQQVGVADRVSELGLPWRYGNSYYRGERVFRMDAPHDPDDRYFPMLNLQQQVLEETLVDAVQANPLIDLRWGNKLTGFEQVDDHVRLHIDTPAGPYTLEADWLVAADGARSTIRTALGLPMEGASYEGKFVIADIRIDLDLPTERLAFFDPEWNPGNTVLMHREPGNIWRIDYQLPEGESAEEALRPESLKSRIDAQLALLGVTDPTWEMDWCSVYSARALTLPDYVHGRILFTGDAAHMLPIFGVRGANTGWQDAHDLIWKLAFQVRGWAGPGLLSSYSQERVGAAREIIDEASKSTRFMAPPSPGFRLVRDAVLSLSLKHAFVRPLFHWRTSRPHDYAGSALNARTDDDALFHAGPADGAPLANVALADGSYFFDHLGASFTVIDFSNRTSLDPAWLAVLQPYRDRGLPITVIAIRANAAHVAGADRVLVDANGHFRTKYGVPGAGAVYLVRPDQHVCARWVAPSADRLQAALHTALGH